MAMNIKSSLAGGIGDLTSTNPALPPTEATGNSTSVIQTISDKSRSCQPTLFGIPQELRDKIFEYVFEPSPTNSNRIDIYTMEQALISSTQAPPSKRPLLACRRLYSEMKTMYSAKFRQYWTGNNFALSTLPTDYEPAERLFLDVSSDTLSYNRYYKAADRDLRHIAHFSIDSKTDFYGKQFRFDIYFKPDGWKLTPDQPRAKVALITGFYDHMITDQETHLAQSNELAFTLPCANGESESCASRCGCSSPERGNGFETEMLPMIEDEARAMLSSYTIIVAGAIK